MINKPYLTVKHIIIELVSAGIALLNLIFVIVMINVNHVDLLSELPQNADVFGSLESLLVIAVVFFIGTIVTIIANHLLLVVVPTSLVFTIIAYRHNK